MAALEAVIAMRRLAGELLDVTLIAPEPNLVLRPMAVTTPFSRGGVDRLSLDEVMADHGGRFLRSAVGAVDTPAHSLTLTTGGHVPYDVLVLAHGAMEVGVLPRALTFGEHTADFSGLLADLEQGYSRSVAFVVPDGNTWSLPLYELALMTAQEAWAQNLDRVELHLVTYETEPLGVFGPEASAVAAGLLEDAGILLHTGKHASVTHDGNVDVGSDDHIVVDRVVALPVLEGRRLNGIPTDAQGFIAVDDTGLVAGVPDVYAVGDATDRPVKQGGLACQQADVTAAHIAARAGAEVEVPPLQQVLRGRLLTGGRDRFFRRETATATATVAEEPLWWPPTKVTGAHLSPYLAEKDLVHLPSRETPSGVEVRVELPLRGRPATVAADTTRSGAPDPG